MSLRKRKAIVILFITLFVAPLFIHVRTTWRSYGPIYFALPHIFAGDEPHYLVIVSSIIKDFDFNVSNNYENARRYGMNDIGENGKYKAIDHHTLFFNPSTREIILWQFIFTFVWGETNFLPPEVPYPRHPEKDNIDLTNFKEYIHAPIGLPLFLSLFLWPFRYFEYSNLYDSFAIFIMVVVALMGVFFLYKLLCEFYLSNAGLFTLVFALGTPFWWYSRSIFPAPLLCSLLLGALYFFLIRKSYLLSGFLISFSILVKIHFLPIVVGSILFIALNRKWKELIIFSIPIVLLVVIQLLHNYFVFRNPFFFSYISPALSTTPLKSSLCNFFKEILPRLRTMLFSPSEGLLTFSPLLSFLSL